MRIYENEVLNTSTYRQRVECFRSNDTGTSILNNNADTKLNITNPAANFYNFGYNDGTANPTLAGVVNLPMSGVRVAMWWTGTYMSNTFEENGFVGHGTGFAGSLPITGIRLYASSGNILAGYTVLGLNTA